MTTPSDDKPKEWREWSVILFQPEDTEDVIAGEVHNHEIPNVEYVQVIERAALTAATDERDRAIALLAEAEREIDRLRRWVLKEDGASFPTFNAVESEGLKALANDVDDNSATGWLIKYVRQFNLNDRLTKENAELKSVNEKLYAMRGEITKNDARTFGDLMIANRDLTKQNEEQAKEIARIKEQVQEQTKLVLDVTDLFDKQNEIIAVLEEKLKLIESGSGRAEVFGLEMFRCPQCASAEIASAARAKLAEHRKLSDK